MRKIVKEQVQRANPGSGGIAGMHPLEKSLFRALAEEMRGNTNLGNLYTLDITSIEHAIGEEIGRLRLMGTTEEMMRWIYEANFEDGGYIQMTLISSIRYSKKDNRLTIRINPELEKYHKGIGGMPTLLSRPKNIDYGKRE